MMPFNLYTVCIPILNNSHVHTRMKVKKESKDDPSFGFAKDHVFKFLGQCQLEQKLDLLRQQVLRDSQTALLASCAYYNLIIELYGMLCRIPSQTQD